MSDNAEVFIRLDAPDTVERLAVAESVRNWLIDSGVIAAPSGRSDSESGALTDFLPGLRWRDVVDEIVGAPGSGDEVSISADLGQASAMANHEPWSCGQCAASLYDVEMLGTWATTLKEPIAECQTCGWRAPLGDWPCEFPALLVGAPVIEFRNWHPLKPEFRAALITKLGGTRAKHFLSHW